MTHKKGFTLIELIIVIALIAILATTVILVINPVKLFQEARDSQRIADLGQMNSALSLALATGSSAPAADVTKCYTHKAGVAALCNGRYPTGYITTVNTSQLVDGTGWVPVNLTGSASGSPLSAWPIDPSNTTTYFYSYATDANGQWKFAAKMESARYSNGGTGDVESTDGGKTTTIFPSLFEVGTNVQL